MGIRTRLTETLGIKPVGTRIPHYAAGRRWWHCRRARFSGLPDAGCGRGDVGLTTMGKPRMPGASQSPTSGTGRQRRRHDPPKICDIARGFEWPEEFTGRVLRTAFVARWHGREAEHRVVAEAADYWAAVAEGRTEECAVFIGEAIGLMRDVSPVAEILARVTNEAEALLRGRAAALVT